MARVTERGYDSGVNWGKPMRKLVLAALLLTGCVAPMHYVPGSASAEEFETDKAECEYEAEKGRHTGGTGLAAMAEFEESYARIYNACMKARGYRVATSS
jgi:hypothetical protein